MERALYDLAEAACGHNSAMQWSLSEGILRRQVAPIFERCSEGDLPPEDALDVAMDFVTAGVKQNIDTVEGLFEHLANKVDAQFPGTKFPGMSQLQEFVLGLSIESEWAVNENVTRRELYPMFVRLSVGNVTCTTALAVFCDMIASKRTYYLELVSQLTVKVTQEIVEASRAKEEAADGDN